MPRDKITITKETILGVPCEFKRIEGRYGIRTEATFRAIRGVHSPKTMLAAYAAVKASVSKVHTDWVDQPAEEEQSECRPHSES